MDFFQKITPNTTLLTPNRRLAAVIQKKYTQWQINQTKSCWPTLDILPLYPSWLDRLWKTYTSQEISNHPLVLTTHQEQILWERILRAAPENESLLQITDTAKLSKSAWETLKRWRVSITDPLLNLTDDSRAFLQWAETFKTESLQNHWLDQNSLADEIIECLQQHKLKPPAQIILIGFTDIAPQYQHLLNQCEALGTEVIRYHMPSCNKTANHIELLDSESEIRTMARWAKAKLAESQSIACIIPKLDTLREEVIRIFLDVFDKNEFNISAGQSLATFPIIYDALQFLNLNTKSISIATLSKILRSPFLGEADRERYKRALYDNKLRNANINSLSLKQLINPKNSLNLMKSCPLLAQRITYYVAKHGEFTQKKLPINEWIMIFNDLLTLLGWPGERSTNSPEYQVIQHSWLPLLNDYASFSNILEPLNYHDALHYLNGVVKNTVFQPESPEAPVQILGLLEAAEIPFEHAWVMGLDDSTWPSRPKPNPFIPLRVQKSLNMPNASAERELVYSQELTRQLQQSNQHIIFSNPMQQDDTELRPSSLIKTFKKISSSELPLAEFTSPAELIFQSQQIESFQDETGPAITSTEETFGGVKIFKTQAECPFKAFAELRLHAKKMEEPTIGLRKLDRGNALHKALELIWHELQDSATLNMKSESELRAIIQHYAKQALAEIIDFDTADNKRYLTLEIQRLEKLLLEWFQIEKSRPPFNVVAMEHDVTAKIGNITANFRVDRIDELLDEMTSQKQLIIDYKTGKDINRNNWFGDRLEEPQLPIYCLMNPEETLGIAFAKVNPNKMGITGASRSPLTMTAITPLSDIKQADATLWDTQVTTWKLNLEKLANQFHQGHAQVDPKDSNVNCRLCGLQSLCRIHELSNLDEDSEIYE